MVQQRSITDTAIDLPTWDEVLSVLLLQDYNTRVVVFGVMLLGLAAGVIGTFMLLRKRALLGDAVSHATLPGIGLAFIAMTAFGASGKALPGLLLGATLTGIAAIAAILFITRFTRLKEDAALGIVLSVGFGAGVAVLGVVQNLESGHAAGLESFVYGKTASMIAADAKLIAGAAAIIALTCALLFKELTLLCFDAEYTGAQGWPVTLLDALMMALVVGVTVIGLQAVGLILMIALLVIPAAAARFWTEHLPTMVLAAAGIGALSGLIGAGASALVPRLPAGGIIVVVAGLLFLVSMVFGTARGVLGRAIVHRRLARKVARQHLLRALYEWSEDGTSDPGRRPGAVRFDTLLAERAWTEMALRRELRRAEKDRLVTRTGDGSDSATYALTPDGLAAAWRVTRNHRLWELYLIAYADVAPSHVDRDADQVEHVLGADLVRELEQRLIGEDADLAVPPSPHELASRLALAGRGA